ncbi:MULTISPECIES: hypothetical protein [Arthrobacter]|uniref:Uncharacterized protein n=1 Tax=Arthrobacter terricola TaxID=2547396 RepID=A0A4V2ZT85_9MICC|nr:MULTISPECIES: hypothetical protein [Arthrobacter]MBT8161287.1 hypothetical protein [Arthrobacter sp. GN70]TDF96114.1 hypothetical protein E1809_11160 [Arthrobacter terricola]
MAERGNTKHSPHLDEKMQQETLGMVRNRQPAHAEEWRETEPFPDDTDPAEVRDAVGRGGREPEDTGLDDEGPDDILAEDEGPDDEATAER